MQLDCTAPAAAPVKALFDAPGLSPVPYDFAPHRKTFDDRFFSQPPHLRLSISICIGMFMNMSFG
jgi:hypothetical protein